MNRMWIRAVLTFLLATLVLAPAVADEPKKTEEKEPAKTEKSEKKDERTAAEKARDASDTVVITNDVLENIYGAGSPPPPPPPAAEEKKTGAEPPEMDALEAMNNKIALEQDRRRLITEAQQRVGAAEMRVADLERRALAIRNPLLPRPAVPQGMEDAWSSMSGPERLEYTEEQLAEARAEVEAARAELSRLKKGQ